jgi:glycosyltransferase involved in cell wall biosynthesis
VRIGIASDFYLPWIGGPATFIANFSAYLGRTGHEVEIIAPSPDGPPTVERREHLVVQRVPTVPIPFGYGLRTAARPGTVRRALLRAAPDVLQIHHPFPIGLAAMRQARRLGIPVVAVNHTIPECSLYGLKDHAAYPLALGALRRYLVWFLEQAHIVSTPTMTAARLLRGMGFQHEVQVISNGIDTGRFRPAPSRQEARAALGLPDKPLVLYTGRLDAEKDMGTWLHAAQQVLSRLDVLFVAGGQGTDRPRLEKLAVDLGIRARVLFPGYYPIEQLPLLYQAADVYCITSAVELQSITTLEALASGLPVVAANARALPELVHDGVNGYLAPPGDAHRFAAALERILTQPALARAMSIAGRTRAEQHALDIVAGRHLALLRETARAGSTLTDRLPA